MLHKVTEQTMHAMVRYFGKLDVMLMPCKMYSNNFACHVTLHKAKYTNMTLDSMYRAWATYYNEWLYYNATYETGYYAHFYVDHDLWVKYNNRHLVKH